MIAKKFNLQEVIKGERFIAVSIYPIIPIGERETINVKVSDFIRKIKSISYIDLLQYIFKEYIIEDCQYCNILGHPDFKIKNDKEEIYIECKSISDSLRIPQLDWIFNNKDKVIYILVVDNIVQIKTDGNININKDINEEEVKKKEKILYEEMLEIFNI